MGIVHPVLWLVGLSAMRPRAVVQKRTTGGESIVPFFRTSVLLWSSSLPVEAIDWLCVDGADFFFSWSNLRIIIHKLPQRWRRKLLL